MQIEWSDKEQERLRLAHDGAESAATAAGFEPTSKECQRRTAVAVASCAVELVAARGGTMTAEDIRGAEIQIVSALKTAEPGKATHAMDAVVTMRNALTTQGATVATLRAKLERDKAILDASISAREGLKGEVTALRAEVERLRARKWIQCTSVSNDCLGGCASMAEHDRYRHRDLLDEVENVRPLVVLHEDLSQQLRTAESEAEKLKADLEDTKDRLRIAAMDSELAESRIAAIRERATSEEGRAKACEGLAHPINVAMAVAQWVLEGDAHNSPEIPDGSHGTRQEAKCTCHKLGSFDTGSHHGECEFALATIDAPLCACMSEMSHTCRATRHPCSATCTHDDAATPGHPERVRQKSEAVIAAAASLDGTAESLADAGPEDVLPAQSRVIGPVLTPRDAVAYEEGAEAMRTACWEIVQTELRLHGWGPGDGPWTRLKAAIEGATP